MLEAILALFACQLIGEAIARGLGLPVPGPVLGMLLMFTALQLRDIRLRQVHQSEPLHSSIQSRPIGITSAFLLSHLSLLFVPAGVGIISHLKTLSMHGVGLVVALVVSTALSLAVTALVFAKLSKSTGADLPHTNKATE